MQIAKLDKHYAVKVRTSMKKVNYTVEVCWQMVWIMLTY